MKGGGEEGVHSRSKEDGNVIYKKQSVVYAITRATNHCLTHRAWDDAEGFRTHCLVKFWGVGAHAGPPTRETMRSFKGFRQRSSSSWVLILSLQLLWINGIILH